jgi:hypothetical protein
VKVSAKAPMSASPSTSSFGLLVDASVMSCSFLSPELAGPCSNEPLGRFGPGPATGSELFERLGHELI